MEETRSADQDQPAKPKFDVVRDLKQDGATLRLHLSDGTALEGKIQVFDRYNLLFEGDQGQRIWVPKHAIVYGEILEAA